MTLAFNFALEHPGMLLVAAITNAGKTIEEVESALDAEIDKLHELVDEEEFQMAKAAKEYELASGLTSLSHIAQELANGYTYFKDADRINKELDNYNSITREDLRDAALKYLNKDNRVVLHYLPESQK
jgi:predicted Zn-dependent peptidase